MMEEQKRRVNKWAIILLVLLILGLISISITWIMGLFVGVPLETGNVAVIPIEGALSVAGEDKLSGYMGSGASSTDIVELIEKADKNDEIKAILLEINSPGGGAVASEEIGNAIKSTNKTTVAWIREVGASGGYWVASASDHIVASRMSLTGSIGVSASYLEYPALLERFNVTNQRLVAGKYKDMGSPMKEMTPEEKAIMQASIDEIHSYFIEEIANNRNMSYEEVEGLATGVFYLGSKAKEFGLVDELGGKKEALAYIERTLNMTAEPIRYQKQVTLMDLLSQIMSQQSFSIGQGIGSVFVRQETPVVMV